MTGGRKRWWCLAILLAGLLCAAGCLTSTPIQVRTVRTGTVLQKMRATALTTRQLSPGTAQFLRRYDLDKKFALNPGEVIHALDRQIQKSPDPDAVFAVSELCYLTGRKVEKMARKAAMGYYAGALAHAYFYLFDESVGADKNPYDPRFRQACDLYNCSLAACIRLAQRQQHRLGDKLELAFADQRIEIKVERKGFAWKPDDVDEFLFASDYEVRGLENHYHGFGLGVPLIAVRERKEDDDPLGKFYLPIQSVPATAFLRMNCAATDARDKDRHATLELYDPLKTDSLQVAGRSVPLECDLTTPLGYCLSRARFQRFELEGLFRADKTQSAAGLYMVQPYEKGKIPVVMIHGIWSSPMTWMQMFNDLRGDPVVRDNFQFWFFLYPTGNPILYSSSLLRQALTEAMAGVDPKGKDPALDQMVLVGHSMGGILAKTMVQDSQNRVWEMISNRSVEKIQAAPAERELIQNVFFFQPQPFVRRVVFIATPHRGSDFTDRTIARLTSKMIFLPATILDASQRLASENPGAFSPTFERIPTSLDNLAPESPVIQATATLPLEKGVVFHSIMGNIRGGDAREGTDGVVPYSSSHLEGAASEYVVDAGHVCHTHPLAVLEVRRILLEHLAALKHSTPEVQRAAHSEADETPAAAAPGEAPRASERPPATKHELTSQAAPSSRGSRSPAKPLR